MKTHQHPVSLNNNYCSKQHKKITTIQRSRYCVVAAQHTYYSYVALIQHNIYEIYVVTYNFHHSERVYSVWHLSADAADRFDSCLSGGGATVVENRLTTDDFSRSQAERISSKFSYFSAWTSCRRYNRSSWQPTKKRTPYVMMIKMMIMTDGWGLQQWPTSLITTNTTK